MTLVIQPNQKCPHSNNCCHNTMNDCWGAKTDRDHVYTCDFVKDGKIQECGYRSPLNETGQMKIIME